ncbi:MAG: hypothetical protein KC736_02730 [Candidatus Moranbacteria bacterium]|nr:hypothetical protein [Candidatus Moranbacteria bacterium]
MKPDTNLIIALGIGTIAIATIALASFQLQAQQQTIVPIPQPPVTETAEEWETFMDDKLEITFKYPKQWGEVIVSTSNISETTTPPCKEPIGQIYINDKQYAWEMFTNKIEFSEAPIQAEIFLLDRKKENIPEIICNNTGNKIEIAKIEIEATDGYEILTDNEEKTILHKPILSTTIGTSIQGPAYIGKEGQKLFWAYTSYSPHANTPEAQELERFECQGSDRYNTEKGCGIIAWTQKGEEAQKVRKAFKDTEKIVGSLKTNL